MSQAHLAVADVREAHAARGRAAPFGGAPRIEDLKARSGFMEWQVRMPEEHHARLGKLRAKAPEAPRRGAGIVNEADPGTLHLEHRPLGKGVPQLGAIDVAADRRADRAVVAKLLQDLRRLKVAEMDDHVRGAELLDAGIGQPASTTRHVGVREDGEPQPAQAQMASRRTAMRTSATAEFLPWSRRSPPARA